MIYEPKEAAIREHIRTPV